MTLHLKKITATLKKLKLDGWSLILQERESVALHLTKGQEVETVIAAARTQADITIYKRFGKHARGSEGRQERERPQLGDARFTVFDDDEATIRAKAKDALLICASAKKPGYPLPKKQKYTSVQLADPAIVAAFKGGTAERLLLQTWSAIAAAQRKERGIGLDAAELDLSVLRLNVANSAGLRAKSESTALFVECFFSVAAGAGKARREQEIHAAATVSRLADLGPARFVRENAQRARDALAAERFNRVQDGRIVLSGDALRDFWSPHLDVSPAVFHASAVAKYRKLSRYALGKRITRNECFTLLSNPALPFNPASSRFDLDGVASQAVPIIQEGVFRRHVASQRYAHYLGVEATGALGSVEILPGAEETEALFGDGTVEIVAFSSFVPNTVSGDFSAEVRLAYVRKDGTKTPIRAAMFSGNLFKMLDAMRLSKERTVTERYAGPSHIRFDEGATLAGF